MKNIKIVKNKYSEQGVFLMLLCRNSFLKNISFKNFLIRMVNQFSMANNKVSLGCLVKN